MAIRNSDGSIILETKVDESGLDKFKSGIGTVGKALGAAAVAGATGFATLTTSATKSYAEYEQLVGGVETLFKDSGDTVQGYADNAYMSAGLSANEYMETVTGFSASLLQSLGGDTAKAAEYGNQAVVDMSDNANKMGTSMESIQNAYQGFAKQNYTMLDNLKLGYGGTKEEMERLLGDASKISGIDYDISSFADITEAIHVIQTEMGITGTTALEAEQTISGSANMMKSSWQNMLTGFADPTQNMEVLLDNFVGSVNTFATNVMPVIENSANAIVQVLPTILKNIVNLITQMLPSVITAVSGIITQIAVTLPSLMQVVVTVLPGLIQSIVSALPAIIPQLITGIVSAFTTLVAALPEIIQPIIDNLPAIILSITQALIDNLPSLIEGCIQLVVGIVAALPDIIMGLLEAVGGIALQIGEVLFNALPEPVKDAFSAAWDAVKAVWDLVEPYFSMIWENIKAVFSVVETVISGYFSAAWTAITAVWDNVTSYFETIWNTIKGIFEVVESVLKGNWSDAWEAIKGIVNEWEAFFQGIWDNIKKVFEAVETFFKDSFDSAWKAVKDVFNNVKEFFDGIWTTIKEAFAFDDMKDIGKNIVEGLWNGINNAKDWVLGKISGFVDSITSGIKNFFGIHSPSRVMRDEIGKNLMLGMADGISKNASSVLTEMKLVSSKIANTDMLIPPLSIDRTAPYLIQPDNTGTNLAQNTVTSASQDQNINITFGGNMGQLIRILQPQIERETARRGVKIVTGVDY